MLMDKLRQPQKKKHLSTMKPSLSRHLLNLKVLPTSKALRLYTTLSSTSTTNCFARMLKQKLDRCTMICNDCSRRFSGTFTNRHWISSVKDSCIHDKWPCTTCSNNTIQTLIAVKKNCALNRDAYLIGCVLKKREITVVWVTLTTRAVSN